MPDLIEEYGIIPFSDVKRFRELEHRYRMGNPKVEGQLRRICEDLRDQMKGPYLKWIRNSNSARARISQDSSIMSKEDRALEEIYELLLGAETLDELIIAVDQTLHAQHKRGIFISEICEVDTYGKLGEITRTGGFQNPGHIDLSSRWEK